MEEPALRQALMALKNKNYVMAWEPAAGADMLGGGFVSVADIDFFIDVDPKTGGDLVVVKEAPAARSTVEAEVRGRGRGAGVGRWGPRGRLARRPDPRPFPNLTHNGPAPLPPPPFPGSVPLHRQAAADHPRAVGDADRCRVVSGPPAAPAPLPCAAAPSLGSPRRRGAQPPSLPPSACVNESQPVDLPARGGPGVG
jgi:hypothetical protein